MRLTNPAVRAATNADAEAVQALIFAVLEEYGLPPDPAKTDRDLFDLEGSYFNRPGFDRPGYFGVVEQDHLIVATVGLLKLDDTSCELRKMYALPSVRGQGLGRLLVDFAVATARTWQCQRMVLDTASVLREAIALYQRYGFKPYHPPCITGRCDLAMELWLT